MSIIVHDEELQCGTGGQKYVDDCWLGVLDLLEDLVSLNLLDHVFVLQVDCDCEGMSDLG